MTHARRSIARERRPVPTASHWRLDRFTWWPICCARRRPVGLRGCERSGRQSELPDDDRAGRVDCGRRDPRVLRCWVPVWSGLPVADTTSPTITLAFLMLSRAFSGVQSGAIFGIKNSGLSLAVNLVILFLVVIWLALVYWTYADARRRIA